MGHIFISYSHQDQEYVYKLHAALENEGFDVWIDGRIDYGDQWLKVIEERLDGCDAFIIVMSRNSSESEMVQNEITRARDKKKRIFPILLEGENWLVVQAKQFVDVRDGSLPTERFFKRLESVTSRNKAARDPGPKVDPELAARLAREKEEHEKAIRDAVRRAARVKAWNTFWFTVKSIFSKAFPFLRIVGFSGIVIGLFWFGLWAIPKFSSFVPTAEVLATQRPVIKKTSIIPPATPSKTPKPNATSTKTQTPPPTSLPTEITDAKGTSMMLVPAGEFTMGASVDHALEECQKIADFCNRDWFINQSPSHQVYLDAFYIDKYEVTNNLYQACVSAGACKPPNSLKSNTHPTYYANPKYGNNPVLFVDWNQAKIYCEWRDGGLPTEAQWEKAARSTDARTYPWGEGITCKEANILGCIADTQEVGSYESGKSPYGIYDLAGNLSEWVADWYAENYYSSSLSFNPLGPNSGQYHVARGGSWASVVELELAAYIRGMYDPNAQGANIGFRCARSTP